jgi:hypothetical protein
MMRCPSDYAEMMCTPGTVLRDDAPIVDAVQR